MMIVSTSGSVSGIPTWLSTMAASWDFWQCTASHLHSGKQGIADYGVYWSVQLHWRQQCPWCPVTTGSNSPPEMISQISHCMGQLLKFIKEMSLGLWFLLMVAGLFCSLLGFRCCLILVNRWLNWGSATIQLLYTNMLEYLVIDTQNLLLFTAVLYMYVLVEVMKYNHVSRKCIWNYSLLLRFTCLNSIKP